MSRQRKAFRPTILELEKRESPTSLAALGDTGINLPLNLNGAGVRIGQLDFGRPGKNGIDELFHTKVNPGAIYDADAAGKDSPGAVFANGSWHGTRVASIMIAQPFGQNPTDRGVTPQADLRASAVWLNEAYSAEVLRLINTLYSGYAIAFGPGQHSMRLAVLNAEAMINPVYVAKSIQRVASDNVSAMNFSFVSDAFSPPTNGSALTPLMLDYFTKRHGFLAVNSISNFKPAEGMFSSAYNGLSVGALEQNNGVYNRAILVSPTPDGTRSRVQLLAPGDAKVMTAQFDVANDKVTSNSAVRANGRVNAS